MNFDQLKELIEQVDASSLKVFELDNERVSVKMSKNDEASIERYSVQESAVSAPVTAEAPVQATSATPVVTEEEESIEVPDDAEVVTAPIVGTAYLSPSPDKDPFVQVGDKVEKGQPLLIVEAMKVMNEIKSDVEGEVVSILVEDGQPIEFGQPLIQIK